MMLNNSNNSTSAPPDSPAGFRIPQSIRFWYFLIFNIFSIALNLFTLHGILSDRSLRRALHNHVIVVLLILVLTYELTDIPFLLRNDQYSTPWVASPSFYLFWVFYDYSCYSLQIALFAWITVERHILIFHDRWVATKIRRIFIHYFPPCFITVYYFVYYAIVYYGKPCDNPFDSFLYAGIYVPCAFDRTVLATWDLMFHQVVPTLIILVGCISLVIRVIWQKARMRRSIEWGKHRKMVIQLLIIASIYVVFNIPWVGIIFAYQCGLPIQLAIVGIIFSKFILYNISFLFPVVCCLSLPELRKNLITYLKCSRRTRQINQTTTNVAVTATVATFPGSQRPVTNA